MKPVPLIASVIFGVVSIAHLARLVFHVEVTVGGVALAMWPSVLGILVPGALAVLLVRDARKS